jgi:cathepsin L
MSIKIFAIVAVAVLGTLAAVHVIHNQNNTTGTTNHHEVNAQLQLLSQGVHEVNYLMLFKHYKEIHNLSFGAAEDATRFNVFKANCDKILAHNADNTSTYELGLTSLSHLTLEEFSATRLGYKPAANKTSNAALLSESNDDTVDWTTKGAVTPIKDQGQCGSCWAFSTTGALEGLSAIKAGKLVSLSEQELVDCAGSYGNQGCNGGLMDYGFEYAAAKGVATESDYPYTATDGKCKTKSKAFKNKAYTDVAVNNDAQLGAAIAQQPVSVAIEADTSAFQLYKSGVLTGSACGTQLDHGVLAVGYGTQGSQKYIKVKNSWGSSWGQQGFVLIGRSSGAGVCGINSAASYPTL